jgi:hypothetical protein
MGLAETAELAIKISLTGNAKAGIKDLKTNLGSLGKSAGSIARGIAVSATAAVGVAGAIVGKNVKSGLESLSQLESAIASVDGALQNAGGDLEKGGLSGQRIATWANEIEAAIGAAFDDKDITQATTTLIRFGKVTPSNLRPAMEVMTDLATKTGDVDSAASLLAKALADPEKAAGKLARSGVILTKEQQKQIKAMVEAGDAAGAQKLLLDALTKTTKGAAAASQGPYQRSLSVLRDVTEDAQRALAEGFLPVIEEVRDILSKELAKPGTLDRIKEFGRTLAGGLRGLVNTVRQLPWDQIGAAVGGIVDLGKNIGKAFLDLPPEAKGLILSLAALNKLSGGAVINVGVDLLKGTGGALFQQFLGKGSVANPMYVIPVGGGLGGGEGIAGGVRGGASTLMALLPASLILGIGEQIGEGIFQALGGKKPGEAGYDVRGTDLGNGIRLGQSQGAFARSQYHPDTGGMTVPTASSHATYEVQRKLDDIRESNERNRIALVSAEKSSASSIVGAIKGIQRPIISVSVTGNVIKTTYKSGTTLTRSVNPGVLKLLD